MLKNLLKSLIITLRFETYAKIDKGDGILRWIENPHIQRYDKNCVFAYDNVKFLFVYIRYRQLRDLIFYRNSKFQLRF